MQHRFSHSYRLVEALDRLIESRLYDAMPSTAIAHKDAFIDGMKQGKNLADIIQALGLTVSTQAISKVLKDDPDYQDAKEDWHVARINRAEGMIEDAAESVDVARARAYWQSVTWRAEREFPARWAAKQQVEHTVVPVINFVFGAVDNSRLIEHPTVDSSVDKDA